MKSSFMVFIRALSVFLPISWILAITLGLDMMIALMVGMIPLSIGCIILPLCLDRHSIQPFHWIETGQLQGQLTPLSPPTTNKAPPKSPEVKGVGPSRRGEPRPLDSAGKEPESALERGLTNF